MDGLAEFDLPLDELRRYRPEPSEPDDFDAFWAATLAQLDGLPAEVELRERPGPLTALEALDATFAGFGGKPVRALVVRPRGEAAARPCVVEFVGYSGAVDSPLAHLTWAAAGCVSVVVEPGVTGRALDGLDAPQRYHYRRVFANEVRAVRLAATLPGVDPERIVVAGASQGGGIALAAGALADVAAVVADVPYGCHYERSLAIATTGPYAELTDHLRRYRGQAEQALHTLSYFDGLSFAARGRAPALFSVALRDTTCPPSTVFAVANRYAGPHDVQVWRFSGHEGGGHDQREAALAFLARTLS